MTRPRLSDRPRLDIRLKFELGLAHAQPLHEDAGIMSIHEHEPEQRNPEQGEDPREQIDRKHRVQDQAAFLDESEEWIRSRSSNGHEWNRSPGSRPASLT